MKIKSAKAKGRRCAERVKELLELYAPDELKPGDIEITSSSVTGKDLLLSPKAKELYPFVIECKNQEKLNIWEALKQAEAHAKEERDFVVPVLFFTRNHAKLYAALDAESFLKLFR